MTSEELPDQDSTTHAPQRHSTRQDVLFVSGIWIATVLAYVAQPVVALLWAGVAVAGGIVFLVQERAGRPLVIAAVVLAGFGMLWMLVQLGALY
jgi:hypothetical protein